MKSFFVSVTIHDLHNPQTPLEMVKFYARYQNRVDDSDAVHVVGDEAGIVRVNGSCFDSISCEVGEWYRFMGEVVGSGTSSVPPVVRLIMYPVSVDGFEAKQYANCLRMKRNFDLGVDDLVAYAYKHR